MKKVIIPVFAVLAVLFVSACAKSDSPEKTINSFLNAVNAKKWDEAKGFATKESESMIDMVKGFADMMPDSASAMKFEIVKDKTKIDGDNAEVTVKDENSNEMAYKLKKQDGAWKVDFTMEALMGDMSTEDMTQDMNDMSGMSDTTMMMEDMNSDTSMQNMK